MVLSQILIYFKRILLDPLIKTLGIVQDDPFGFNKIATVLT